MSEITSGRENTGRPKGYAEWRPHRKTRAVLEQVQEILQAYREHLPMTIRQIFYRLVGAYGYPKTEKDYRRLCEYMVRARRARVIPFSAVRDDGLSQRSHDHHDGEEGFYRQVRMMAENFTQDKLALQEVDIRVYCEAEGMLPQLETMLEPYSVPAFSCSGFDSLSAKWNLLRWALGVELYDGKLPVILHLGDYDPDGEGIFEAVKEDVLAFMADDDPMLARKIREAGAFSRVALTAQQIDRFELPTAPPKEKSSRTASWQGDATCQLEALEPDDLDRIVSVAVRDWLDLETLEIDREREITVVTPLVCEGM